MLALRRNVISWRITYWNFTILFGLRILLVYVLLNGAFVSALLRDHLFVWLFIMRYSESFFCRGLEQVLLGVVSLVYVDFRWRGRWRRGRSFIFKHGSRRILLILIRRMLLILIRRMLLYFIRRIILILIRVILDFLRLTLTLLHLFSRLSLISLIFLNLLILLFRIFFENDI